MVCCQTGVTRFIQSIKHHKTVSGGTFPALELVKGKAIAYNNMQVLLLLNSVTQLTSISYMRVQYAVNTGCYAVVAFIVNHRS